MLALSRGSSFWSTVEVNKFAGSLWQKLWFYLLVNKSLSSFYVTLKNNQKVWTLNWHCKAGINRVMVTKANSPIMQWDSDHNWHEGRWRRGAAQGFTDGWAPLVANHLGVDFSSHACEVVLLKSGSHGTMWSVWWRQMKLYKDMHNIKLVWAVNNGDIWNMHQLVPLSVSVLKYR